MHLKLDLFENSMYVFTWKSITEVQFVSLQNTHQQALFFITNQQFLIDFLTNKTEQYLQVNVFVSWWHITCYLQFRQNSNSQSFYYFLVLLDSRAKSWQTCGKTEGNFEILKCCYIQILYPAIFFLLLGKGFWSSTCLKFRVD